MKLNHTLTIFIVLLAFGSLKAQLTAKVTNAGTGYLELLPPDYDANPTKKYPLMIFLHGKGERGSGTPADLERVKRHGPPLEASRGHNMCFNVNGVEECFILIAPQLSGTRNNWGTNAIDPIFDFVLNESDYRVDLNRVYLTGLSLGGGGVYRYAPSDANFPNQIAAISAIAGWGRTSEGCIISERNMAMWSFHGDNDRTVGFGSGVAMYNAVNNCTTPVPTAEVRFTVYEGVGHNSWSRAYRTDNSLHTPNLYEWLLSKSLGGNPTANAGPDQDITLPTNSLTLNGTGSDPDGSITSYAWVKSSGPAATLTNQNTQDLSLSNLVEGVYNFTLTVTDNDGNTGSDQVEVVVNPEVVNLPPGVNAGQDFALTLPTNSTNITASATDSDGSIASYEWTQRSGPSTATLSGTTLPTVSISALVEGTYRFRVTVTDDDGASAFDNIDVTVNPEAANMSPVANAGSNISINLPTNSATLSGSGSDGDGSVTTYLWEKISGPTATLTNQNTPTLSVSNLVEGIYNFRLTVTDDDGDTGSDNATVTVVNTNQNPTANAGGDIIITLPTNTTTLNGGGSDPDGSISAYQWTQLNGPGTANIASPTNPITSISNLVEGVYQIELVVTDDDGASDTDVISVTVNAATVNTPPIADAGSDISITLPTNTVVINGSGTDADGTIVSYFWQRLSGPSSFMLTNENTASVTVSNLVAGVYFFRLTVTDDDGATDTNSVRVNVAPEEVNQAPTVNAGADASLTLPNNSITLTGSASDADGSIASYVWSQASGPSSATLSGQSSTSLMVSNLLEGSYIFQLSVTDDDGASASDDVTVVVSAVNQPPTVSAGPDVNLVLPTNTTTLSGTALDSDGLIINSTWVQLAGPNTATQSVSGNSITVSNLIQGNYTFQFIATDNGGLTRTDDVNVFVTASNMVPVVNAGADRMLVLPNNSLNLSGTASDSDGTVVSFSWNKVSGPAATLSNQNTATVTVTNLVEGIYIFRLTAEDDDGDTASDQVSVTVSPAMTNTPPVADAGSNLSITLPTNIINVTGTGSDSDGSIATYQWVKKSGPTVTIVNGDQPTMTANNLVEGTYVFTLNVTDDDGDTDSDDMQLIVNPAAVNQVPSANAGPDIQLFLPTNSTNLTGSGNDPDGTINQYEWNLISGPNTPTISGSMMPTVSISNLIEGVYLFELNVTDDDGASATDNMTLTVSPAAANNVPVANAGMDQTLTLPTNSTNLVGTGSDTDGSITSYLWTKASGPTATLLNASSPTLTVSNLIEGVYAFRLTVTDDDGDTGTDDVTVRVLPEVVNQAPVVDAGSNFSLTLPANGAQINGSASDRDGSVVSFLWEKLVGGTATLSDATQPSLTLSDLIEGSYTFRLTATDDDGATGTDEVTINVLPEATNMPPAVSAGDDQNIFLPSNSTSLVGNASDNDGTIATLLWEKVSGPNVTISAADQTTVMLSDLNEGTYIFSLTAVDDDGAEASDEVMVQVLPTTTNQAPVANAGSDRFLFQPENSIQLGGSGTDADGTIVDYEWSFIIGPEPPTMSGANTQVLAVSDMNAVGGYTFRLQVTDDGGLVDIDDVQVFVSPDDNATNVPPTADAGQDRQVVLPENEAEFIAIAEDDGLIQTYSWEQLLGPTTINMTGLDSDTLRVTDLLAGEYIFEVTVIDDLGAVASDQVVLSVIDMGITEPTDESAMKVFSPNGDGQNDLWILGDQPSTSADCELIIFNSQGSEVFQAQPYQNNWDGTFNGEELREGVYFYVLRCNGSSDNETTGSITLIR